MILENGFVKIKGATDLEDSSMAVGVCAAFDCLPNVDIFNYFNRNSFGMLGTYRRCLNSKYLFSRDQTICFVVALYKANMPDLVSLDRVDGKDFFSPSVRGHIRICQGLKPTWFQTLWFKADLLFSAKFKPLEELNQLFCMLMVHPDQSLIKWYCEMNPQWEEAIRIYFCNWRDEPELAELMIDKIWGTIQTQTEFLKSLE